ncbi:MAG: serine hydroxymethyltransferase [Afipia sp. 62-7]|nr:DUF3606 domain-containing protein [Afipia sp.]OJU15687.1 MAG: serine hydroxymethyltransferase [Afipia sp. 62-7]
MIHLVTVASVLASNTGVRAPSVIDTTDDSATSYWATKLNISPDDLAAAIQEVGPSVAAVRRHLGK